MPGGPVHEHKFWIRPFKVAYLLLIIVVSTYFFGPWVILPLALCTVDVERKP